MKRNKLFDYACKSCLLSATHNYKDILLYELEQDTIFFSVISRPDLRLIDFSKKNRN